MNMTLVRVFQDSTRSRDACVFFSLARTMHFSFASCFNGSIYNICVSSEILRRTSFMFINCRVFNIVHDFFHHCPFLFFFNLFTFFFFAEPKVLSRALSIVVASFSSSLPFVIHFF